MSRKKSILSVAVGSAFVLGFGNVATVSAADNPFSVQPLEKGYMVADAHQYGEKTGGEGKCGEGKCGEGKCGGKSQNACGEGKCGAAMADANNDGRITREEWAAHHDAMFKRMDANQDGYITKEEAKSKAKEGKCGGAK
jgi:uncharacterized low-complexity protein